MEDLVEQTHGDPEATLREDARQFLPKITSPNGIYELFDLLNYPKDKLFDSTYKRDIDEFDFKKDEREKVKAIYTVFSYDKDLPIFLVETTSTTHPFVKYLTKVLADRYLRFLLIVTSNYRQVLFVLPDYERVEAGKHKLRISKLVIDKDDLYHTDLETIVSIAFHGEDSWRELWKKWREAFDVEKVTRQFFLDYQEVFFKVRSVVSKQKISNREAHEFTLQLLNRIMFIYFVSKKRWLNNDTKFLRWLWERYVLERSKGSVVKDTFYSDWLTIIFFEAFNNKFRDGRDFPEDVKKVFQDAPYLNGGLFRKGELDSLNVRISDDLFKEIFRFFQKYNFTIKEDLLDAEVAVDPQMIGYVYESLANVAESSYEPDEDLRGAWGIFYTPRVEVEFMCKRCIVEYLSNHVPRVPRDKLFEFVFDDEREKVELFFEKERLWYELEDVLDNLSIIDPACGSGAFLVGMVNVLSDLYKVIYKHVRRNLTDFELKNKIIMHSLYGVDVMPWAIHAAELRLWLQLVVESDLKLEDLKSRPLLPNLNMNLRIGDSLVQAIGGLTLHIRDPTVSPKLKQGLANLKIEKEKYFNNDSTAKFKTEDEADEEEARLFAFVIKDRMQVLDEEAEKIEKKVNALESGVQKDLAGRTLKSSPEQIQPLRDKLHAITKSIENLESAQKNLTEMGRKPFVWEIDFAEIFGEKGGFDVVIGNPPYVRLEEIGPPERPKNEVSQEEKREYVDALLDSVKLHLSVVTRIDRKSDYYVYFYFHGLSLLNERGTFCFVTSNSWLDADYGAELQEFLLKYVPIRAIYDNPKRSFAHADINTVISVFGAPLRGDFPSLLSPESFSNTRDTRWPALTNKARLVMFKKPFEEVVTSSKVLLSLEKADRMENTADYRIFVIDQKEMLLAGWRWPGDLEPDSSELFRTGGYAGSKWGGKWLRAPDIFFTILERAAGKLAKIPHLARIETYLNTGGADNFFIVREVGRKDGKLSISNSSEEWGEFEETKFQVEEKFLKPFIKSPREVDRILIRSGDAVWLLLSIPPDTNPKRLDLDQYIKWGVKVGFSKRSGCRHRSPWWKLPPQAENPAKIVWARLHNDKHIVWYNPQHIRYTNFYGLWPNDKVDEKPLLAILNSTVQFLFREIYGKTNFGGGAIKTDGNDIEKMDVLDIRDLPQSVLTRLENCFERISGRPIQNAFGECGIEATRPIREQKPNPPPDRKMLDDIIFDVLGLTEEERAEVYWSVCELVSTRLAKARSLKKLEN